MLRTRRSMAGGMAPRLRSRFERSKLRAEAHTPWRVFALFNHDLGQIYVGASDAPVAQIDRECGTIAAEINDWESKRHRIDWIPAVGEFPNRRTAGLYAAWLAREGAFEGVEDYAIGIDDALVADRTAVA